MTPLICFYTHVPDGDFHSRPDQHYRICKIRILCYRLRRRFCTENGRVPFFKQGRHKKQMIKVSVRNKNYFFIEEIIQRVRIGRTGQFNKRVEKDPLPCCFKQQRIRSHPGNVHSLFRHSIF